MADTQPARPLAPSKSKPKRKKLPRLPRNAKVEKRPLLRPAIPSPYAGANQPKIVYISSKTPFLSAVKRVEKLLNLADKRLVQSAATSAKQTGGSKGKRERGADGGEILGIVEEVERLKGGKRRKVGESGIRVGENESEGSKGEEVVMKGTGKAIHRVLELALWFQQREEEYVVRLNTGTVSAIDDITVEEETTGSIDEQVAEKEDVEDAQAGAEESDDMGVDVDYDETDQQHPSTSLVNDGQEVESAKGEKTSKRKHRRGKATLAADEVPETRIRYTSVLEAAVSLR